jgi:SsrA-binding protein
MGSTTPEIRNRKAFRDYHIEDRIEAGIVLSGTEVKSVRMGQVSIREAYVDFSSGRPILIGLSISQYMNRGYSEHGVYRPRKLLMHKREVKQWARKVLEKGYTVVPLRLYFNDRNYAKLEIGLGRGKREYDKRAAIADREAKRDVQRAKKEAQSWNR